MGHAFVVAAALAVVVVFVYVVVDDDDGNACSRAKLYHQISILFSQPLQYMHTR